MYIIDKIMINSYENSRTPILFLSEYNENYPNMDVKCYYNYFDKIYGIEIDINKIKFVDKEASLNNFYKNGGNFTEEEFKSLKFSKLYDIRNLRKKKIKFYPIFKWQQIDKEQ